MEFEKMTIEELEQRKAAIPAESEQEGADVDALLEELRGINAEIEKRKAEAAKREEIRSAIAGGAGTVIESVKEERKNMDIEELRSSAKYIDAYAEAIKSGDEKQLRALLSENGGGTVVVPTIVDEIVRTAWEKEAIMSRVKHTRMKGNVKVGFELSATDADVHEEGAPALDEETVVHGTVEMVPKSIKKWITVSDEALDLRGPAFLDYVYRELVHKIAMKASRILIGKITALTGTASATAVNVGVVTSAPVLGAIAEAMSTLSDEASDLVVIMNKASWGAFKKAQYNGNFNVDPFEGLPVLYSSALPAYNTASAGAVWAIVGDLNLGAQANFPGGEEITVKVDDLSLAEKDLVKFVGREYVGIGVVGPLAFAQIKKPASV